MPNEQFDKSTIDIIIRKVMEDPIIDVEIRDAVESHIDRRVPLHDNDADYYIAYEAVCVELLEACIASLQS